jgi:AcrR family transcriptional regulator
VVRDVLEATLRTFAEEGYGGLSIEAVATRAGVNKTTVYRRWPTKAELLGAALRSLREQEPPTPDTGSLREDLLLLLTRQANKVATPAHRAIMHALLLNNSDPELAEVVLRLRRESPAIHPSVIERAVQRGQLPRGTNTQLIIDTLLGALHSRAYWKREMLSREGISALVELVVSGAEAGGACGPGFEGSRS